MRLQIKLFFVIIISCTVTGIFAGFELYDQLQNEQKILQKQQNQQNQLNDFKYELESLVKSLDRELLKCGHGPIQNFEQCESVAENEFKDNLFTLHKKYPIISPNDYELPTSKIINFDLSYVMDVFWDSHMLNENKTAETSFG